ncbi:MAG: DUF1223 domain-containing protein [Chitinophagales bacterium]
MASLTAILGLIFNQKPNVNYTNPVEQSQIESANSGAKNTELQPNTTPTSTSKPFAVIELFTSQGCSSCPPADHVLRDIIEEAEKAGKPIYGLSFHVDYWNYLGWNDPYSHADFSNRQRDYNQRLKSRGSYTPQMIVNGVSEFIGSKRTLAYQEVANALEGSANDHISIELTKLQLDKTKNKLTVDYQIEGDCKDCKIHFAAVESNLKDVVKRGENHGRTLKHDNVVRTFRTVAFQTSNSNKVTLSLPKGMNFSESAVIVYVQKGGYGQILGADRQTFGTNEN